MKQFILMADIIKSSEKKPEALMTHFKEVVAQANKRFGKSILSPLTITLGDEFQGVVKDMETAVELIFFLDQELLTAARMYRLRYVIHYGEISTPLNKENSHGMLGEGLTFARRHLEKLKHEKEEVSVTGLDEDNALKINLAFGLYRALYNDWPEKDRRTAYDFISIRDYKEMAKVYDKDVSTMWRKERSLKMHEFYQAKALIKLLIHD